VLFEALIPLLENSRIFGDPAENPWTNVKNQPSWVLGDLILAIRPESSVHRFIVFPVTSKRVCLSDVASGLIEPLIGRGVGMTSVLS